MEHRFLQQQGRKMEKNIKFEQNTPLWDNSLSIEERLDYLTGAMTLEEKIHCLTTGCPDIPEAWNPGNLYGR